MKIRVEVRCLYTEKVWMFTGTERQVQAALLLRFPWLRSWNPHDRDDLEALLEHITTQQAFTAASFAAEP